MSAGEPVHAMSEQADEALPDYVLALQQAASYLTGDQQRLLRRAW